MSLNGQEDVSYNSLQQLLQEGRDSKDFSKLAKAYLYLGDYENEQHNDHEKAFEYYTRSEEYYKLLNDTTTCFLLKSRIAHQYKRTELYRESLELSEEVIEYYKEQKLFEPLVGEYLEVADLYGEINDQVKKGIYLEEIEQALHKINNRKYELQFDFERIEYFEALFDLDKAIELSEKAYQKSLDFGDGKSVALSLHYLGKFYMEKYEWESAIRHLNNSLVYLGKSKLDPIRLNIYRDLAASYEEVKDDNKAYTFVKLYSELNDSILNRERIKAINNVTFKYEAREKNNEIKLLEKENFIVQNKNNQQKRALYILGIVLALLTLSIYYITRFYRQRIKAARIINTQREEINKQRILQLENEVQIKSMQSMIDGQEIERERIAKDLHDSLGGLLSTVKLKFETVKDHNVSEGYNQAQTLLDHAVEEVRTISRNLQPSALKRLGLVPAVKDLINRYVGEEYPYIDFQHYNIPKDIDNMVAMSMYRIIQELFNNAIKYADADEILLQLNIVNDEINIQFEDDGKGFDVNNTERKGMGLENIHSRVNYLKGTISLDSEIGEGTSYFITVKYKNV